MITRVLIFIFLLFFSIFLGKFNPSFASPQSFPYVTPVPTSVDYPLPYPGILPDHPLYFLKKIRDKILEVTTTDPVKKVELYLLFSDKHLSMGQILWEKGNHDLTVTTLLQGEKYLLSATIRAGKLKKEKTIPPGLSDKIDLSSKKHEEVITKLILGAEDEAIKGRLKEALSITHQASQQISSIK